MMLMMMMLMMTMMMMMTKKLHRTRERRHRWEDASKCLREGSVGEVKV